MQLSRFYQIHYQSSQLITSLTRLIYQLSATSTLSSSYHYLPPNLPFISKISPIVWRVNFQNIGWLSRALCVPFFFLLSLQIRVNTISRLYMWSLAALYCNILSNILAWCAKVSLMLYRVRRLNLEPCCLVTFLDVSVWLPVLSLPTRHANLINLKNKEKFKSWFFLMG